MLYGCEVYQNLCVLQAKQLCAAELQLTQMHALMNASRAVSYNVWHSMLP